MFFSLFKPISKSVSKMEFEFEKYNLTLQQLKGIYYIMNINIIMCVC